MDVLETMPVSPWAKPMRWMLRLWGLLVLGFLYLPIAVLVLFSVSLVGEILEIRRQQMFIDSVTHELKSPLASLKLCLETMARPGVSVSQQDQLRGMMQSDVERLTVFGGSPSPF